MDVLLANPRGFCAGVDRAIEIVERARERCGAPIYGRHGGVPPRGFCAGVDRAIEIVERALETFGAPIFVRHEVVHNRYVVDKLRGQGAVFVDELEEVPDGATVIFSAHGVSQAVRGEASTRGLRVFDATCPLVTKVHMEVARHGKAGRDVILIGHAGHPEVEGTMGQWDPTNAGAIHLVETPECVDSIVPRDPAQLAYVT